MKRLQIPPKAPSASQRNRDCRNSYVASPRPNHTYTRSSSYRSMSVQGTTSHGLATPSFKLRRHQAKKEILRRALTPPVRTPSWRWWNFRPLPSRLSNMSMA
ncbi:unnamed protein product [Ilex paraguariensis]|uniref:Uncharacterized protein n=1 Tax=Ilex paraguariensis TaxID=185542 RepID=A0ABC8UPQ8_9AQUA